MVAWMEETQQAQPGTTNNKGDSKGFLDPQDLVDEAEIERITVCPGEFLANAGKLPAEARRSSLPYNSQGLSCNRAPPPPVHTQGGDPSGRGVLGNRPLHTNTGANYSSGPSGPSSAGGGGPNFPGGGPGGPGGGGGGSPGYLGGAPGGPYPPPQGPNWNDPPPWVQALLTMLAANCAPAPTPKQPPAPSMTRLKGRDPELFDRRDPRLLRPFVMRCMLAFQMNPQLFHNNRVCILYAGSFLKGNATS